MCLGFAIDAKTEQRTSGGQPRRPEGVDLMGTVDGRSESKQHIQTKTFERNIPSERRDRLQMAVPTKIPQAEHLNLMQSNELSQANIPKRQRMITGKD